jgi:ABC-type nitrate/sulfonate/bicarbonate transport system substrate-binding protein
VQGIISRRTFAAGLGAAAITAPAFLRSSRALAAPAKVSFCLPWIPHGGYAFLFAAKKLGFWGNRALEVQVDRGFGSGETCKRVALGQYDYGLADFATMTRASRCAPRHPIRGPR